MTVAVAALSFGAISCEKKEEVVVDAPAVEEAAEVVDSAAEVVDSAAEVVDSAAQAVANTPAAEAPATEEAK